MTTSSAVFCAAAVTAAVFIALPAQALTMQECSAKYKAAQAAGTAKGVKWNDFRKAECGSDASAAAPATTSAPPPAAKASSKSSTGSTTKSATGSTTAAPAGGNAVFPSAVSPKYSSEPAGKARMHTCLDQYNANKADNGNGGLNWIQKGGGYYAQCNKRLKG